MREFWQGLERFMWLALDLPIGLWPVTLALAGLGAWSACRLFALHRFRSGPTRALLIASVVIFIGLPLFTFAFQADPQVDTPESQELPSLFVGIAIWGYVALAAVAVVAAKGYRLPLAGCAALLVWVNSGVMLVAAMAVSGVWL
jgi:hypothetical protein